VYLQNGSLSKVTQQDIFMRGYLDSFDASTPKRATQCALALHQHVPTTVTMKMTLFLRWRGMPIIMGYLDREIMNLGHITDEVM